MRLTINVHCETTAEAEAVCAWLGRMPSAEVPIRVREREPGDDIDNLINDIKAGRPVMTEVAAPPPPPKPKAPTGRNATPVYDGVPRTGRALYKWGCDHKVLPAVNAAGKALSYPRLVSEWDESQVARVFGQLGGVS